MKKRVAVFLCGSGFKDGSEIRESVALLWALSKADAQVQCFAPDAPQTDVVNCLTQEPMSEKRNMMVEAARIARGEILPVAKFEAAKFDALILPGGFGVAKNLCSFASQGSTGSVRPDVLQALRAMHASHKPIGAICIAPTVLALAFKNEGFELTLGAAGEASQEIEKLGHKHIQKKVTECHVDKTHKIVTTPAYMDGGAALHAVFTGIEKLVEEVLKL